MQPGSAGPCAGLPSQRPDASQIMPECQQAGLPQGRKELVLARWYLAPCGGSRTSSGAVERGSSALICNGDRQIRQFGVQTVNAKPKS